MIRDEDFREKYVRLIQIKSAVFIGDYVIQITFDEEDNKLVVFKFFLEAAIHPFISKYLYPYNFIQFTIADGNIN